MPVKTPAQPTVAELEDKLETARNLYREMQATIQALKADNAHLTQLVEAQDVHLANAIAYMQGMQVHGEDA